MPVNVTGSPLLIRLGTCLSRDSCHWLLCQKFQDPDPKVYHFSSTSRHVGWFKRVSKRLRAHQTVLSVECTPSRTFLLAQKNKVLGVYLFSSWLPVSCTSVGGADYQGQGRSSSPIGVTTYYRVSDGEHVGLCSSRPTNESIT